MFLCRSDTCSCFFFCWSRNKTMPCSFFFNFVSVAFTTDDSVCLVFERGFAPKCFYFFLQLSSVTNPRFLMPQSNPSEDRVMCVSKCLTSYKAFCVFSKVPADIFIKITDLGNSCSATFFAYSRFFFTVEFRHFVITNFFGGKHVTVLFSFNGRSVFFFCPC